jgi:hypothetical protein
MQQDLQIIQFAADLFSRERRTPIVRANLKQRPKPIYPSRLPAPPTLSLVLGPVDAPKTQIVGSQNGV